MKSNNPVLRDSVFSQSGEGAEVMTVDGVINKTGLLLFLCMVTFAVAWYQPAHALPLIMVGGIGGFIVALITCFAARFAFALAPIYALLEGLFLGALSGLMNDKYHGIAVQAAALTFGTLAVMLGLYRARIIRVTEGFRTTIIVATCAIAVIYLASMILGFFSIRIPYIHESGWIGIGFSLLVVGVAALNLILDFDYIEQGAAQGAPKYLEWYAGFSLLVTLVWLYLEILRLLAKLRGRD